MQEITFKTPDGEEFIIPIKVVAEAVVIPASQLNREESEWQTGSQAPSQTPA